MRGGAFSLLEAAVKFESFAANMKLAKEATLAEIAILIRDKAKAKIGTYQSGWPELAESTVKRKGNDKPLLDTGALRDSIGATVFTDSAYVGTNEMSGVYAELGTKSEPPRSFLLSSAVESKKDIGRIAKKNIHAAWVGNHEIATLLHALHLLLEVAHEIVRVGKGLTK
jgi:phage gpG-like protein